MPEKPNPDSIGPGAPIWERSGRSAEEHANAMEKLLRVHKDYIAKYKSTITITSTYELRLKRLQREMVKLRTEQSQFTKSTVALATKIQSSGGIAGALTRFTGGLATLGSSVDKTTGLMKILGGTTTITKGAFSGYLAVLQVTVGIYTKFLDVQDKARIKQAGFIRQFGALNNISISAPYEAAAKGIEIAGSTGEKAAERLFAAVARMRSAEKAGAFPLGPEVEEGGVRGTPFARMVKLTTGALPGAPEYLLKLREVFAKRPTKDLVGDLEAIAMVARDSGVPIEQFVGEVFALGEAFVAVGVDTSDSIRLLGMFGDAVGKLELPMQMVVDFARQTEQQLKLAQGVPNMLTVVHFIAETFNRLPERLQQEVQGMTAQLFPGAKFGELGILKQAEVFQQFDRERRPQVYQEARLRAAYLTATDFERQSGIIAARVVAPIVAAGTELGPLKEMYGKLEAGGVSTLADILMQIEEGKDVAPDVKESVTRSLDEFKSFTDTVAELQEEFTANFRAMWERLSGWMVTTLQSGYPGAGGLTPEAIASIKMGSLQVGKISEAIVKGGFTKPEEVLEFLANDPIWKQRLIDYGDIMMQSDLVRRVAESPTYKGMPLVELEGAGPNEITIDAGPGIGHIKLSAEFIRSLGTPSGKAVGTTLSAEDRQ